MYTWTMATVHKHLFIHVFEPIIKQFQHDSIHSAEVLFFSRSFFTVCDGGKKSTQVDRVKKGISPMTLKGVILLALKYQCWWENFCQIISRNNFLHRLCEKWWEWKGLINIPNDNDLLKVNVLTVSTNFSFNFFFLLFLFIQLSWLFVLPC